MPLTRLAASVATTLFALACLQRAAAKEDLAPGSCTDCHQDLREVVAEKHPALTGSVLASCTAECHKPSAEAKKDGFSAALHASHAGVPDCAHCHPTAGGSFVLAGANKSLGLVTKEDEAAQRAAHATWASGVLTASLHRRAKISCRGCHGEELPLVGSTVGRARCIACHDQRKLIAKTDQRFKDRNPHKSHVSKLECTTCHKAHGPSKVSCVCCHLKSEMQIPGR